MVSRGRLRRLPGVGDSSAGRVLRTKLWFSTGRPRRPRSKIRVVRLPRDRRRAVDGRHDGEGTVSDGVCVHGSTPTPSRFQVAQEGALEATIGRRQEKTEHGALLSGASLRPSSSTSQMRAPPRRVPGLGARAGQEMQAGARSGASDAVVEVKARGSAHGGTYREVEDGAAPGGGGGGGGATSSETQSTRP